MEQLAIIIHNFFRANGFHKSRSPSSRYDPAPQGSQLITLPSVKPRTPQKKKFSPPIAGGVKGVRGTPHRPPLVVI